MKKILFLFVSFCIASAAMAETTAATDGMIIFSPAISMALAAGACGLAQGKATMAACEGIARNPGAANNIRNTLILGLVLIESLALYTLVVAFVKG